MLKAPKAAKARSKAPAKKEKEKAEPRKPFTPMTPAQKKQALRSLMNKVNNKAKHTVMAFADDVQNPYFLRRPSGILQLDIDTGGGIPAGGLSMISGPDNAGKTYVMFKYMAMHQRLYGNDSILGYAPTEMAPDYWFMRDCGMKVSIPEPMIEERQEQRKFMGLPPFTKEERAALREQIGEFIILTGHTAEDLFDVTFASVKDNIFGIIGIDSFTMAAPEALMNLGTFHDNPQMAASAGLTTKFLTKFSQYMLGVDGRNNTTVIGTQQVRTNPQLKTAPAHIAKYLPAYAPAGGYATKHGKMLDILLMPGDKFREKGKKDADGKQERGAIIGKSIKWRLIKGKAGTHDNIEGEADFDYEIKGVDEFSHLLVSGMALGGIIEENGKLSLVKYTSGEIHPEFKGLGRDSFFNKMTSSLDLELAVRYELLGHAGIECAYR
jgi:RecA/RadA recombinase